MTARIEIGRLSAVDLGKTVSGLEGVPPRVLMGVEHFTAGGHDFTIVELEAGDLDGDAERSPTYPTNTLIEITGRTAKENA